MEIIVTGRHFEVDDALKNYVDGKINSIISEYHKITSVRVILAQEKTRAKAEIIIHGKHINYEADSESFDMYRSIDETVTKIDKQLSKHFDKIQDHHKIYKVEKLQE
jgi:putative sigma-54 modulation protein